ncbi:MAG: hypothetical protein ACRD7E_15400 [Bryobacteraceae bacterium]
MSPVTVRKSTIVISVGEKTHVFRSVDEVPAPLRRKLDETTTSGNSATILIADKRGREELIRSIQGHPSSVPFRVTTKVKKRSSPSAAVRRLQIPGTVVVVLVVLAVLLLALMGALLIAWN